MRKGYIIIVLAVMAVLSAAMTGCKTTEANYRAAYEKTIAAREEGTDIDSTIYGAMRRQSSLHSQTTPSGEVEVLTQLVKVSKDGGGIGENLRRYNVVVGQFKQQFNARSLRDRWADGGYPSAFVVETGEPYYYVVLSSHNSIDEAAEVLKSLGTKPVIAIKEPCPFILDATARRQTSKNAKH